MNEDKLHYQRLIGLDTARQFPGGKGEGVRVFVYENGVDEGHEDLQANFTVLRGAYPRTTITYQINHGTAVCGIIGADENLYGTEGIAPEALTIFVEPVLNSRELAAVIIAAGQPGDIVSVSLGVGDYSIEYAFHTGWEALHEAGFIVCLGAGNGGASYADWHRGTYDSGAILVGGCTSREPIYPHPISSYGERVDCCAPAGAVYTTLLEQFTPPSEKKPGYGYFGGTSASTPVVAGCCAVVQGILKARGKAPLSPGAMRELVRTTGNELDFVNAPEKVGGLGRAVSVMDMLKQVLQIPDFNADGRVGFGDFLTLVDRNAPLTLAKFLTFARHYGKRWPGDYPLAV